MDKIRVMIVEDSLVVREFLQRIIGQDPRLEVIAAVDSAEKALRMLPSLHPDVISMDIHLPGINGYEATQRIMQQRPTPVVIVSGCLDTHDLKKSMEALRAGALSVVEKPVGTSHHDYQALAERLCTQLAIMSQVRVIRQRFNGRYSPTATAVHASSARLPIRPPAGSEEPFAMLGLVASTGGPAALQTVLRCLGPTFALPIVVVQHITTSFHDGFVQWLDDTCSLPVVSATNGQRVRPGCVHVAPADRHLEVHGNLLLLGTGEPVCAQRPSGTILFRSMAASLGRQALAVLLTGMGEDGADGLKQIRDAGGYTLTEDESTAVVYGMPAVAARLGAVVESLPLGDIGPRLRVLTGRVPAARPRDGSERTLVGERQ